MERSHNYIIVRNDGPNKEIVFAGFSRNTVVVSETRKNARRFHSQWYALEYLNRLRKHPSNNSSNEWRIVSDVIEEAPHGD